MLTFVMMMALTQLNQVGSPTDQYREACEYVRKTGFYALLEVDGTCDKGTYLRCFPVAPRGEMKTGERWYLYADKNGDLQGWKEPTVNIQMYTPIRNFCRT